VISNKCQVIKVGVRCQVIACQVISTVDIVIAYSDTGKQYRYRGTVRIQEINTILKNRIISGFKLFTTIEIRIIVELSSRQASKQHPSEAKQC